MYVAFGPGGAGDIVARAVSREMTASLHQPVVVDNRPAPMVADTLVAKSKPDGYSLMATGSGTALTAALFRSPPYDLFKDFAHVSTMAFFSLALVTAADSPFKSVADVIAQAKAQPGKLNIGTVRIGSTQNLTAELFRTLAGIEVVLVPYRSTADLVTALRSRDVQVAVEIVSPLLGQIRAGTLRPLAVTSTQRFGGLPEVPTVAETLPGFDATSWIGISVAAGTPPRIVATLNRHIGLAVASPAVQKVLGEAGMLAQASTPEAMTQRLKDDLLKWRGVIDKAGIERQ
jgi:tripartite-type tricarboxylate transporter receptor subunit TctC